MNSTTSSTTTTTTTTITATRHTRRGHCVRVCVYRSSGADEGREREKPSTTTTVVRRCHFGILIRDGRSYSIQKHHTLAAIILLLLYIITRYCRHLRRRSCWVIHPQQLLI